MTDVRAWVQARYALELGATDRLVAEVLRRAASAGRSTADYLRMLEDDAELSDAVLEIAVPAETWLFRNTPAFEHLRAWLAARPSGPVRLASLGCAGGAEAFSMAATAASLHRDRSNTRIVAVDRNAASLSRARRGRVTALGQRSALPNWATPWFRPVEGGGLELDERALAMIEWRHEDLTASSTHETFDAVMCRNVALYLDEAARLRLGSRLAQCVAEHGRLFVGHADPPAIWIDAFRWLPAPHAFALERVSVAATPRPVRPAVAKASEPARIQGASRAGPDTPSTLQEIRAMADAGELRAAHDRLQPWLERDPMDAEAWWLAAALALARGRDDDAERCLQRVLYLAPMHGLALLQSSSLAERRGDRAAADRLRLRAERAMATEAPS